MRLLWSNDLIYDWGSDVLPVYVETVPEGAFEDLGFAQGVEPGSSLYKERWYLVEPLDSLDQLSQVVLDNSAFLPRYEINGLGSISVEAEFEDEFSIGLHQYIGSMTINSLKGIQYMLKTVQISWTIEVYDKPSREQFFGSTFSTDAEENYYQQWSSAVDVATFIPLVFSGDPSVYDSGTTCIRRFDHRNR